MVEPMATVSTMMITFMTSLAAVLARRSVDQHFLEQIAEHQHGDQRRDGREEQVDDNADDDREGDLLDAGDRRATASSGSCRSSLVVSSRITGGWISGISAM